MWSDRAKRGARPARRAGRLTERDVLILHAVGRMKEPTAAQIAALFFGDASACHRRLRRLHGMGLVAIHAPDVNGPNVVVLSTKGASLLETRGYDHADLHVSRTVERVDPHLVSINDLRVGLTRACRARPDIELDVFLADPDIRRAVGFAAREAFIPDALVRMRVASGGNVALAYEVDLAHESGPQFGQKVRATLELHARSAPLYGLREWRPVVLAPDERRLRLLARHIHEAGGAKLWVGGLLPTACRDPLGPSYMVVEAIAQATSRGPLPPAAFLVPPANMSSPVSSRPSPPQGQPGR